MSEPESPQLSPYGIDLEVGKSVWWCACGKSSKQPLCDGSHKGSGFSPLEVKVQKSRQYWLCGCKKTATPPFCDGSHKTL